MNDSKNENIEKERDLDNRWSSVSLEETKKEISGVTLKTIESDPDNYYDEPLEVALDLTFYPTGHMRHPDNLYQRESSPTVSLWEESKSGKLFKIIGSVITMLSVLLLVISFLSYGMSGEHGRDLLGYTYFSIENSDGLWISKIYSSTPVQIGEKVVVVFKNDTEKKYSIQTVEGIEYLEGIPRYETDYNLLLDTTMISGYPFLSLPYALKWFGENFLKIFIGILGAVLFFCVARWILKRQWYLLNPQAVEVQELEKKGRFVETALQFFLVTFIIMVSVLGLKGETRSVFGYYYFTVLTKSMHSVIPQHSLIFVKEVDPNRIEVGQDITFITKKEHDASRIITHRVIEIIEGYTDTGERGFRTKGVDNSLADADIVAGSNVLGLVVKHVENIGAILFYVKERIFIFLGLFILLLVFFRILKVALKKTPSDLQIDKSFHTKK